MQHGRPSVLTLRDDPNNNNTTTTTTTPTTLDSNPALHALNPSSRASVRCD
jgi:hypothetical protein